MARSEKDTIRREVHLLNEETALLIKKLIELKKEKGIVIDLTMQINMLGDNVQVVVNESKWFGKKILVLAYNVKSTKLKAVYYEKNCADTERSFRSYIELIKKEFKSVLKIDINTEIVIKK